VDALPWRHASDLGPLRAPGEQLAQTVCTCCVGIRKVETLRQLCAWSPVATPSSFRHGPLFLLEGGACLVLWRERLLRSRHCGDGPSALDDRRIHGQFGYVWRGFYRNLFWSTGSSDQVPSSGGRRRAFVQRDRCYFDDPVHEVFGISSRDWQSFYHFTVVAQSRTDVPLTYRWPRVQLGEAG